MVNKIVGHVWAERNNYFITQLRAASLSLCDGSFIIMKELMN